LISLKMFCATSKD